MELTWLDDFIALDQTRNFTRAAQERNTTQSAYSRRIQRLEDWIGAELFIRDTRPVGLTRAGEEFAKRAHRLREDIFDIRRITANASTKIPDALRIYTTNTLAIGFLPNWIKQQNIKNYSLVVSNVSTCLDAVQKGICQTCFVPDLFGQPPSATTTQTEIYQDKLVLCAATDIQSQIKITDGTLNGPLMLYTPGTAFGQYIMKKLHEKKISLPQHPVCESASAEALLAQVRAGLGAAWLPEMLLSGKDRDLICRKDLAFAYPILQMTAQPHPLAAGMPPPVNSS